MFEAVENTAIWYCADELEVTVPTPGAPPSVRVQTVPTVVQVTAWPLAITAVGPKIVFVAVMVAGLPQIVWNNEALLAVCTVPAVLLSTPSTSAAEHVGSAALPSKVVPAPQDTVPNALVPSPNKRL